MSLSRFHILAIAGWFVTLLGVLGLGAALGVPFTFVQALGLLLLACLPPFVLVTVFRGAPPNTIAQVLYNAGQTPTPGRQPVSVDPSNPTGPVAS